MAEQALASRTLIFYQIDIDSAQDPSPQPQATCLPHVDLEHVGLGGVGVGAQRLQLLLERQHRRSVISEAAARGEGLLH